MTEIQLPEPLEFEWDIGNEQKNVDKHGVGSLEIEQVFVDPHRYLIRDRLHSSKELRYIIMGHTRTKLLLFIAFTIRANKVRAISARPMKRKEREFYEEKISFAKVQK